MFRRNDVILLAGLCLAITVGVIFPAVGRPIQPLIQYLVMFLLFLSFLSLEAGEIWQVFIRDWRQVA